MGNGAERTSNPAVGASMGFVCHALHTIAQNGMA